MTDLTFPFVPAVWSIPILQSMYAGFIVLALQLIAVAVWRILAIRQFFLRRVALLVIAVIAVGPSLLNLLIFAERYSVVTSDIVWLLCSSLVPLLLLGVAFATTQKKYQVFKSASQRLKRMGIEDAISKPDISTFENLLAKTTSGFLMLGVGAEKVTRNASVFEQAMHRCATQHVPARFLLVAPDVEWVSEGATRRGLDAADFRNRIVRSLRVIATLKERHNTPIEVRFYTEPPLFRMLFINNRECHFGYYSESVITSGENEFANHSHPVAIIRKPEDMPADRQLYGVLLAYFEKHWLEAEENSWDFKTYLT